VTIFKSRRNTLKYRSRVGSWR